MASWLSCSAPLGVGALLMQLDLGGYLMGTEFLTLIAGLVTAFFSGLANVLIGNSFALGA